MTTPQGVPRQRVRQILVALVTIAAVCSAPPALAQTRAAAPALTVVNAGPTGEVASLAEANEVRVVFSEPMVVLGRIPAVVQAPFFRIAPAVRGTFRWSGTTILIFTPDPKQPLPFATKYEVTIETTAVAVSGRRLAAPHQFSFTTPTVKLLSTSWYRRGGRASAPVVALLQFNQPVRAADVAGFFSASFQPHPWRPPAFLPAGAQKPSTIDPQARPRFEAKVRDVSAAAAADAPVRFRLTKDWDRTRYPESPSMVVLESVDPIPSESWVNLVLDPRLPSPAGAEVPGTPQSYTMEVEHAFFIEGFHCAAECNPSGRNPLMMTSEVMTSAFARAVTATDVTDAAPKRIEKAAAKPRSDDERDRDIGLTLEDAGFEAQPPARTYTIAVSQDLTSADGQRLGYTWVGTVENWHESAFSSFGDGHGVWESSGGPVLPFYSRNFTNVTQWAAPVAVRDLMPTLLRLQPAFNEAPDGPGTGRRLGVTPDRIQSHGLDLSKALGNGKTGLAWTAVQEGEPIANAHRSRNRDGEPVTRASLVQVTNLGITVKDSPQNTLIFVTHLDTGAPVPGARVSIVQLNNQIFWTGTTSHDGVAIAPQTRIRKSDDWWELAFVVTAEKDGDVAYVGSDWNEGIRSWDFGMPFNLQESTPMLRGSVFSDRGVYRLGEEVHLKAVLRYNAPDGIRMLPEGTPLYVVLRDGEAREVDRRTVKANAWSSAEWSVTIPADGTLGSYWLQVMLASDRPKPKRPEDLRPGQTPGPDADNEVPYLRVVTGSFLVAAYRRPDFRVDVTLTGTSLQAGDDLKAVVTARYLFGAPMGARPLTWSFTKAPVFNAPAAVLEKFPEERWAFVGYPDSYHGQPRDVARDEVQLTPGGVRELTLQTQRVAGYPYSYTLEADVEDVSRQHIANRASVTVHPAPWYIGVKRPSYFVDQKTGVQTEVIAVAPNGSVVPGVPVEITLTQVQWISVRRAEGNGFYTWDTDRREDKVGTWTVTTGTEPVPLSVPLPAGGYFILEARASESDGRASVTTTSFYGLGTGYTAWARFDHNRIELVPERKTYKPGDTARIMIQSPWEQATALVTTEREGIRSHQPFALTSTQQYISVPISEADIPNVFVSVLLVKGRSRVDTPPDEAVTGGPGVIEDPSDPGKPSFRLGYVELKVEDETKRLTLAVTANKDEYRPATNARVNVSVKDWRGQGARSEVTLWAVDYGVLSLTGYRTPDLLGSVYVQKSLQVTTSDNRQRIISRRVLTPKGETEGGGGGADAGAGTLRKDFRVLAFWLGSVVTDANGQAGVDVKLPESLTTYRIMAVAGDRSSRFGSGEAEVRVNKPLTLKPTFPRFLAVGDAAYFGAVVTSQLPAAGTATVEIRSLDPDVLAFTGTTRQQVELGPGGSIETRFDARGGRIGRARVQMTVKLGSESDAFEDVIPVEVLASPETVAAYGSASAEAAATETLAIPAAVVPGFGGLDIELSSTAMVGLGEGARYLVEYPYGCAEQRGSRTMALVLATDLGDAFSLPDVDPKQMRPAAQQGLKELERFQCGDGGFAYWPGACWSTSPYLTSYLAQVLRSAQVLKYDVSPGVLERAYSYLERELAKPAPVNESWWPAHTAWQAFAVKVLAEGGRNQDSNITRLYEYRERMPVFALAYLHDAIRARPASATSTARLAELGRRLSNAILPEAGSAHVEELSDPYLLWFWSSNVRSTAIVLNTLVGSGAPESVIRPMVRWMMAVRKDGRWGNTQENAHAMQALVAYYRKYESEVPDFTAVVRLGTRDLATDAFKGRTTESTTRKVPMTELLSSAAPGATHPLTFAKQGTGTLFYTARLRYASDQLFQDGLDSGIAIARSYAPFVESGTRPAALTYNAGDLVRVTLTFDLTKERRFVAVTDPLPAGFEAVESWFASTASTLAQQQYEQRGDDDGWQWWLRGGFDRVERHDDRIQLFATRLAEGRHEFTYIARATTAGTFRTAPARAEEMYEPEVFGRTGTAVIEVKK